MKLTWFKKYCLICNKSIHDRDFLCEDCNFGLKRFDDFRFVVPQHVDSVHALWVYDDLSSHLIQRLKFHEDFTVLPFLVDNLFHSLKLQTQFIDVIIPVPLHYSRLLKRGFNQSGEIGKCLAKKLGLPFNDQFLKKVKKTKAQAELHLDDRSKNLRAAFMVQKDLSGMHIALVDDVMTTGSTVNEVAKVLKQAGAKRVEVWVLAHALKNL